MRRGVLQQFDAPQRLYETPANLFVASFIGSPAMNMLEGTIEREGDGLVCRVGSATLPLPAEMLSARPALARYAGKSIAVGIRPEALDEPGRGTATAARLRGIVRAVEALGPEQLAYVEVEAKPVLAEDVLEGLVDEGGGRGARGDPPGRGRRLRGLVARLDASASVRPDDAIELAVDLRKLHFFDLDSGATIGRS